MVNIFYRHLVFYGSSVNPIHKETFTGHIVNYKPLSIRLLFVNFVEATHVEGFEGLHGYHGSLQQLVLSVPALKINKSFYRSVFKENKVMIIVIANSEAQVL